MTKFSRLVVLLVSISFGAFARPPGPGEVVKQMYTLANEGEYAAAETNVTKMLRDTLNARGPGTAAVAYKQATRNGTIKRIDVVKEDVNGDEATVYSKITFKDGATEDSEDDLIREDGLWKVTYDAAKQAKRGETVAKKNALTLLEALRTNGFASIYKMDYDSQRADLLVKRDSPQFLVEKRLTENFLSASNSFFSPWDNDWKGKYGVLTWLAKGSPKAHILETKEAQNPNYNNLLGSGRYGPEILRIFVSLQFDSSASAPFDISAKQMTQPHSPIVIQNGLIKQTAVSMDFTLSGLFLEAEELKDARVLFENAPPTIEVVWLQAVDPDNWSVSAILSTGGLPPYKDRLSISKQGGESFVTLIDKTGATDKVAFTTPSHTGYWGCLFRYPLGENGLYRVVSHNYSPQFVGTLRTVAPSVETRMDHLSNNQTNSPQPAPLTNSVSK